MADPEYREATCARDLMKHIRRFVIALVLVGLIGYFIIPAMFLPSGVWRRRVVRENPLKAPTQITSIRGDTLIADRQAFRLAGVALPTDSNLAARTAEFLRVVTAQGVEIIRPVQPGNTFILRCEPRIWHSCGNDSVKAHYEQFNLNELLVAFGYATVDHATNGLSDTDRLRLKAAEALAKQEHRGMWSERPGTTDRSFIPEFGLKISATILLETTIKYMAEEMTEQR